MEEIEDILTQIVIRKVTYIDLPALEWDGEYKHYRRLFAEAFRRQERGEALMWMAEIPHVGIVGQIFVHLRSERTELADGKHRAYLYGFRVRPNFQNQGIGSKLLDTAEKDLAERGFRQVVLNVSRDNHGALRLYQRKGYRILGGDPGHWSYIDDQGVRRDVIEPAWRLEKHL